MLHMFHTYVPRILSGCCVMFAMIFKCFSCFFKYFRGMFQVFHLSFFGCDKVTTNCFQTPSKFSPINLNLQLWPTTCRNMATCSSIELLIVSVSRRLCLKQCAQVEKRGSPHAKLFYTVSIVIVGNEPKVCHPNFVSSS